MRFARLHGEGKEVPKGNKSSETVSKLKAWLWPKTTESRQVRITQYKDIGIFIGSIVAIWLLEDRIRDLLEIDTDELRKLSMQQARYPM